MTFGSLDPRACQDLRALLERKFDFTSTARDSLLLFSEVRPIANSVIRIKTDSGARSRLVSLGKQPKWLKKSG